MSEPSSILFEAQDGYAVVTLNRPDRLNSFNAEMHERLRATLTEVKRRDDVRALLLTGAGRGFCAGQDLSDRVMRADAAPVDLGHTLSTYYNPLVRTLRELPKPVVCAVNGVAAGAGANIALACDLVLAARSASFIQAFCKLGLVPDSGGTYFLPRLAGTARAMGLAMLGERLGAEDAERWGLIWKCVDDARLMDEARALARALGAGPTKGFADIKRAIYASATSTLDAQLDYERDLNRELGRTDDYREGVSAFTEKRAPKFRGR
jgi:2-(1,2-epoxy-1,2-dihydrophenyl)acetyl-CoA isomerase